MSTTYEITLRWMPQTTFDDKSTLVQVMALWCQATSHYLNQCWHRSLLHISSPIHNEFGVTPGCKKQKYIFTWHRALLLHGYFWTKCTMCPAMGLVCIWMGLQTCFIFCIVELELINHCCNVTMTLWHDFWQDLISYFENRHLLTMWWV